MPSLKPGLEEITEIPEKILPGQARMMVLVGITLLDRRLVKLKIMFYFLPGFGQVLITTD